MKRVNIYNITIFMFLLILFHNMNYISNYFAGGNSSDEASYGCVDVQTSVPSSQIVMDFSSGKEDG